MIHTHGRSQGAVGHEYLFYKFKHPLEASLFIADWFVLNKTIIIL